MSNKIIKIMGMMRIRRIIKSKSNHLFRINSIKFTKFLLIMFLFLIILSFNVLSADPPDPRVRRTFQGECDGSVKVILEVDLGVDDAMKEFVVNEVLPDGWLSEPNSHKVNDNPFAVDLAVGGRKIQYIQREALPG